MSSLSYFYKVSKNNFFLRKIYLLYNVYVRNFQYHFIDSHKNSQFGEEKLIMKHFKKNFKGRFVDIGCFHPTRNNNTYKMYRNGWKGINIDLNQLSIDLFKLARPNDINICTAISDKNSKTDLYFINELDTKNTIEKNHTKLLKKNFFINMSDLQMKKIRTQKLENILAKHKYFDIDFMNIDIEGHELKVLKTIDFNKFKIKVICVEIINHNKTSQSNNKKIFNLLKNKGYILKDKVSVNHIFKKIR